MAIYAHDTDTPDEAPAWLLAQAESLILSALVDEPRKAALLRRLNAVYTTEELEALRAELLQCQPPRPVRGVPHPDDELSLRLLREP